MSLKFDDFKGMIELVGELGGNVEKAMEKTLYEAGNKAMAKTKARTPVDTGHLRNMWELSDIEKNGDEMVIYLTNNASSVNRNGKTHIYASDVEYGHRLRNGRWMTGYFMSTTSIAEVEGQMDKIFKKHLKDSIGGM